MICGDSLVKKQLISKLEDYSSKSTVKLSVDRAIESGDYTVKVRWAIKRGKIFIKKIRYYKT